MPEQQRNASILKAVMNGSTQVDNLIRWRAVCAERCQHGSGRGSWKHRLGCALAPYSTDGAYSLSQRCRVINVDSSQLSLAFHAGVRQILADREFARIFDKQVMGCILSSKPMFTSSERECFTTHGLFKRQGFLSNKKLANARSLIFEHLERAGIWRTGSWRFEQTAPDSGMAIIKPLNRHPGIVDLARGETLTAVVELVGSQSKFPPMDGHPGLLFTLPNTTTWTLPHQNWHVDFPRLPDGGMPGVQIFAILERVEAGGGGTLAVMGSHRLLNEGMRISSADLRKRLMRETYFSELMSKGTGDRMRFLNEIGHVGDVELKVAEMTGEPGDVYFMDLRVLHTVSPNKLQVPRIMLTERYLLESASIALNGQ